MKIILALFFGRPVLLLPGSDVMIDLGSMPLYEALLAAPAEARLPSKLLSLIEQEFGLRLPPTIGQAMIRRPPPKSQLTKVSWELSLACDYDCPQCYLGERPAASLPLADRYNLLQQLHDAGVLILRLTGGEIFIDRYFAETYRRAAELGFLLELQSNGSKLHKPELIRLLKENPPQRLTLSLYGASADTYARVTRTKPGNFVKFCRGVELALAAGIKLRLSVIITEANEHERSAMIKLCEAWGVEHNIFDRMSPTFNGDSAPLDQQSQVVFLRPRNKPAEVPPPASRWMGCGAGTSLAHIDPLGRMSACIISRGSLQLDSGDPAQVDFLNSGLPALTGLGQIAEEVLARRDGCESCSVSGACGTCPPVARLARASGQNPRVWCQHG